MNASAVVLNRFVFPSSPAPAALAAHRAPRRARVRAFDSRLRVAARAPNARSRRIDRVAIAFDRESRKRCVIDRSIDRTIRSRSRARARARSRARSRARDAASSTRARLVDATRASRSRARVVAPIRHVGSPSLFREKARDRELLDRAIDDARRRRRSIARGSTRRARTSIEVRARARSIDRGSRARSRDRRPAATRRQSDDDGDDGDDARVGGSAQGRATDGERDRARARRAERVRCATRRDATRRRARMNE